MAILDLAGGGVFQSLRGCKWRVSAPSAARLVFFFDFLFFFSVANVSHGMAALIENVFNKSCSQRPITWTQLVIFERLGSHFGLQLLQVGREYPICRLDGMNHYDEKFHDYHVC